MKTLEEWWKEGNKFQTDCLEDNHLWKSLYHCVCGKEQWKPEYQKKQERLKDEL